MTHPNWSTIIYDELIWHKIQVIRYERAALANITLKWHEIVEQIPGALTTQPHIRNIRAAAQHFIASDMKRILEDFVFYSKAQISDEMFAAYQMMNERAYLAMRSSQPLAFDLIPWKHLPEETLLEISKIKYLGSDLDQFVNTVKRKQLPDLRDEFQASMIAGESIETAARRLRDSMGYSLTAAKAVARTAINAASNRGLDQVYRANRDLMKGLKYTATLDTRTCEICGGYDGSIYSMKESRPHTPVHINCRCLFVPVMKSAAELGLGPMELPETARASMDGAAPETLEYPDWFLKQKAARQQAILGKKKYADWKSGAFTPKFLKEGWAGGCAHLEMLDILFAA
jgi:SPP1 gp7 family putative phage head morphogenesis protein